MYVFSTNEKLLTVKYYYDYWAVSRYFFASVENDYLIENVDFRVLKTLRIV